MTDEKTGPFKYDAKCEKCGKEVWNANDEKDRERAFREFSQDKGTCRHCGQEHFVVSVGKNAFRLMAK